MEKKRSTSLSARQAIGILITVFSLIWTVFVFINGLLFVIALSYPIPGYELTPGTTDTRIVEVSAIMCIIGLIFLFIGVQLLRDKKGMYIKFLKN